MNPRGAGLPRGGALALGASFARGGAFALAAVLLLGGCTGGSGCRGRVNPEIFTAFAQIENRALAYVRGPAVEPGAYDRARRVADHVLAERRGEMTKTGAGAYRRLLARLGYNLPPLLLPRPARPQEREKAREALAALMAERERIIQGMPRSSQEMAAPAAAASWGEFAVGLALAAGALFIALVFAAVLWTSLAHRDWLPVPLALAALALGVFLAAYGIERAATARGLDLFGSLAPSRLIEEAATKDFPRFVRCP